MQGVKNDDQVKFVKDGIYFNGVNNDVDMNKYQGKKIRVAAEAELVQAKHDVFTGKWGFKDVEKLTGNDKTIYDELIKVSKAQG